MATAILQSALSCVKSLQKAQIKDEMLFSNPQNATIASAMSLLSNTANYIESAVNGCTHLFDIEILILCKVKNSQKVSEPIDQKHFVLWNTLIPTRSSPVKRNTGAVGASPPGFATNEGNEMDGLPRRPVAVAENRENLHPSEQNKSDHTTQESEIVDGERIVTTNPTSRKECVDGVHHIIPINIASECLCLLLDASGFSSHKNCFQQSSYTNLGSKILIEALRKVFEAESKRRKNDTNIEDQPVVAASDVAEQVPQSKSKTDIIYTDLLPDHLRFSRLNPAFAMLPLLKLSRSGKPSVLRREKVSLNIRKPDRNKKSQNFAILCILFQHTGRNGTCASVLRKYAEEGLSSKGCSRRMKFSAGPNSNCGGFEDCKYLSRKLCTFFDEERTRVGMGTVDPLEIELNGRKLREGELVVRFGVVDRGSSTNSGISGKQNSQSPVIPADILEMMNKDRRAIWKRSLISRITLRADYGTKVATAILVETAIPKDIQESLMKTSQKRSRNQKKLDVSQAIVVCDVKLVPETPTTFRYPYAEWYNIPCLKPLKVAHFPQCDVPDIFSNVDSSKMSSLLWHKSMFDVLPPSSS